MKLETICNKFAAKILGAPGTVVECMDDVGSNVIGKGLFYTVRGIDFNDKMIQIVGSYRYFATRFRKAD